MKLNSTDLYEVVHTADSTAIFKFKTGDYKDMVIGFSDVKFEPNEEDEALVLSFRIYAVENPNNIDVSDRDYRMAAADMLYALIENGLDL